MKHGIFTFVEEAFDVKEHIGECAELLPVLEKLSQVIGYTVRVVVRVITHLDGTYLGWL